MVERLDGAVERYGYRVLEQPNDRVFYAVELNDYVKCFLLTYGTGVFVIEGFFEDVVYDFGRLAFELYYLKKLEQKKILSLGHARLSCIKSFMNLVWGRISDKDRKVTASPEYKHHGLSYVLSVYYLPFLHEEENRHEIGLLMNPEMMSNILDESSWQDLEDKIQEDYSYEYESVHFSSKEKVVASWSGVLVLGDGSGNCLEHVIEYENLLQSAWFLYDSTVDQLYLSKQTGMELQQTKNL